MSIQHIASLPQLAEAIKGYTLGGVHTSIPAIVTDYDQDAHTCSAKPVTKYRFVDADTEESSYVDPAIIPNIPIWYPGNGAGFSIVWTLAVGDPVMLVFAERSIEEWATTGQGNNTPQDTRRFDTNDAVAIPMYYSTRDKLPAADSSATVFNGACFKFGSSGASALVGMAGAIADKINEIINVFNTHTHATAGSIGTPTPPAGPPLSPTDESELGTDTIKSE